MLRKISLILLCVFALFIITGCDLLSFPKDNANNPGDVIEENSEQKQIYKLAVESGYKGTYEEWLDSIRGDVIVVQVADGHIQWKYSRESNWKILISLSELAGEKGADGLTPEFKANETHILWKYTIETESEWRELTTLDSLKGETGEQGLQGIQGEVGPQGEQGIQGETGKSAYETFKEYYPEYTGTEKDWITDVAIGNTCNLFGHTWDEGIITKEPTKVAEGEKTYTCEICKENKYEVIPMIEVADAEIYVVDGIKYVNYGSYPQTHVGDETLIAELNKLTDTNDRGYYEYNGKEYARISASPDKFGSYNDSYGNIHYYLYNDGTKIQSGISWFVVEPIKWRIISENGDGSYQLYSEYILDATSFCNYGYLRNIDGVDIRVNNYKYSNVRAWLNGYDGTDYKISNYTNKGFYDLAFKDSEKGAIVTTEVDNSASTTASSTNEYVCENTFDKIYLLSYQDLINTSYGFPDYSSRCAKVTDYAIASGLKWDTLDDGYYWLRSPLYQGSNLAHYVYNGGGITHYGIISDSKVGIRAACTINIE